MNDDLSSILDIRGALAGIEASTDAPTGSDPEGYRSGAGMMK